MCKQAMELPPLPSAIGAFCGVRSDPPLFSADQMHEYAIAALKEAIKTQGEPVAVTRTGFKLEWCAPHYGLVNGDAVQHPDGTPLYAAAPTIPEGWKLVPIEPTLEMIDAGLDTVEHIAEEYKAMLSAAPEYKGEQP